MQNLLTFSSFAAVTAAVNLGHFDANVPLHVHSDPSFPDDGFHSESSQQSALFEDTPDWL